MVTLIVVGVLLICGGSGAGLFAYAQSHKLLSAVPTATVIPTPTPTPTSYVIYQNSLATKAAGWTDDLDCSFKADGYHVIGNFVCFAPVGQKADVDISVDVREISGPVDYAYGISFRYEQPDSTHHGNNYFFGIDDLGNWVVWKEIDQQTVVIGAWTPSSAIKTGPNATNRLRARALGEQFDFFINGTFVGHVDDSRFTGGYVGTAGFVGIASCGGCDVLFSNIVVADVSQV